MRKTLVTVAIAALSAGAYAAPMMPRILSSDWGFGAYNADVAEYYTNGAAPDSLVYTASPANGEVTGYWPVWPDTFAFPVLDLAGFFGGDFTMNVAFDGHDEPYVGAPSTLDVSLTGTGGNPFGPDLAIFGAVGAGGAPPAGLQWEMDIESVSMYGYGGWGSYVFEAAGFITGGAIAQLFGLVGHTGVVRGQIDFQDFAFPSYYDPLAEYPDLAIRAGLSGEVGEGVVVPEPASALILLGLAALARRR